MRHSCSRTRRRSPSRFTARARTAGQRTGGGCLAASGLSAACSSTRKAGRNGAVGSAPGEERSRRFWKCPARACRCCGRGASFRLRRDGSKFDAADAFADNIAAFRLLPACARTTCWPWACRRLRFCWDVLLIVGWRTRTAAFCALVCQRSFSAGARFGVVRGIPVECGCFGSEAGIPPCPGTRLWLAIGRDCF